MLQRPNAIGLFVCEQVIIEEKTRNITVVNNLTRMRFRTFPSPSQRLVVYGMLNDGLGDMAMSLVVTRLDSLQEIFNQRWQMSFRDPLKTTRLILRLPELIFPVPMRYQFGLLAENETIAQSVVHVLSETVS